MKSFTRFRYISYLDLVCCSFGGALLLFLISASASSVKSRNETLNETVVIRSVHKKGPKAEICIQFKRPGDDQFQMPGLEHKDIGSFSARSGRDSGGETFLVLTRRIPGLWQFRIWQKDFPVGSDIGGGDVELKVIGDNIEPLEDHIDENDGPLRAPGSTSARIVRVRIHPSE